MHRKIKIVQANKLFFLFTVLYFGFQILLGILVSITGPQTLFDNMYGILLVNQYAIILIPVLIFIRKEGLSFREVFRLNRPGLAPMLIIAALAVPANLIGTMLNNLLLFLLQQIGSVSAVPLPAPQSLPELGIGLFVIGVSPAICEELLHRGVMLRAYENRGTLRAMFISAIFFGIFHFDITNLLGTTALGLLFAFYVVRTNSIFAGMLAHFLNNALSVFMMYIWRDEPASTTVSITPEQLGTIVLYGIVGILVLIPLLLFLNKLTFNTSVMKSPVASVTEDIGAVATHWPVITILSLYLLNAAFLLLSMVLSRL